MRKLLRLSCVAFSAALITSRVQAVDAHDRLVDPTNRVGAVTETTSEADLVAVYGAGAVTRSPATDGQADVTTLFAGTPDEMHIVWKTGDRAPRRIVIDGSAWKTAEGLSVGTPFEKLEEMNGGSFDITGANWDRPIRVVSWKGGKLPPSLQVDLGPADGSSGLPKKLRSQRAFFESTNPALKNAGLVVKRLILEW